MEKEAKSRTIKYIEQVLKEHEWYRRIADHIKALPEKQMSHVKDTMSRVINSNEKFRKGLTPEYETILSNLSTWNDLPRIQSRLGVYDVSHLPSYTSQSLAAAASPTLRATVNDRPGKIPFVSRLLSKLPGTQHFVPRYKVQRTDVDFTPQQLNTIRDTSGKFSILQHYDSPMYEVVLPNQGPNAPRLVQNLYGLDLTHVPLTEKSKTAQLRLRFGDESVQTIDKLIADASPSKLYHGGNGLTSIPGARRYTGRHLVEAPHNPLPDGGGLYERQLKLSDADRALVTNPNTSKLALAFTRPGLYFGYKLAKRLDEAAKGKSWYTAIPSVGHAYATHRRLHPANIFVPEHVYKAILSDKARLSNTKSFPDLYLPGIARLLSPD